MEDRVYCGFQQFAKQFYVIKCQHRCLFTRFVLSLMFYLFFLIKTMSHTSLRGTEKITMNPRWNELSCISTSEKARAAVAMETSQVEEI